MDRPDILVVEGLNVLQAGRRSDGSAPEVFLSDFFDFSVYVDAAEADIQRWYVDRFLALRRTAFQDTTAFFHRFAALTDEQARETALGIWAAVNGPNLRSNIAPTRSRARLVLQKATDHSSAGSCSASSDPRGSPTRRHETSAHAGGVIRGVLAVPADSLG